MIVLTGYTETGQAVRRAAETHGTDTEKLAKPWNDRSGQYAPANSGGWAGQTQSRNTHTAAGTGAGAALQQAGLTGGD